MKPGEGNGRIIGDITNGVSMDELRRKWAGGDYGEGEHRPRADYVKEWLRLAGRG